MLDITKIPQKKFRSREVRDKSGNLVRTREEYWGVRAVNVVTGFDRFTHYFLDCIFINVLQLGFTLVMNRISPSPLPFGMWMVFLNFFSAPGLIITYCYFLFFEWKLGATPGKMIFGKVVINKFAESPDLQTSAVRSLIRFIPFEAFSCFSDRGWHDQWSETYVVTKKEKEDLALALHEANQNAAQYAQQQTKG